jgi:hypothetical protein
VLPRPESGTETLFLVFRFLFLRSILQNEASSIPIRSSAQRSSSVFKFQLSKRDKRLANMYPEMNRAKNASTGQGLLRVLPMSIVKADARPGVNLHQSAATVISI